MQGKSFINNSLAPMRTCRWPKVTWTLKRRLECFFLSCLLCIWKFGWIELLPISDFYLFFILNCLNGLILKINKKYKFKIKTILKSNFCCTDSHRHALISDKNHMSTETALDPLTYSSHMDVWDGARRQLPHILSLSLSKNK